MSTTGIVLITIVCTAGVLLGSLLGIYLTRTSGHQTIREKRAETEAKVDMAEGKV